MIRFRDDDVLIGSKGWDNPLGRFKQIQEWCELSRSVLHVPALVCGELSRDFRDAEEYIKEKAAQGKMAPEIHGLWHLDYGAMDYGDVSLHIALCKEYMTKSLGVNVTRWYTPWGANSDHLYRVAESLGLKLIDCSEILTVQRVHRELREGTLTVEQLEGREVFLHWWERGNRVHRVCLAIKHGSWAAANAAEPGVFRD